MRKRFAKYLLGFVIALLIPNISPAFAADECPILPTAVSTSRGITDAISAATLVDGKYVVCLSGSVGISNTITITGKDKPLVIYGLDLQPGKDFYTHKYYSSLLLSVTGSDITFHKLTIGSAEILPTSALQIVGSNISVIDSQIHASQTGIAIGTAEKAADNIVIAGTTVAGNGTEGSKGISITNSNSISISAGSEVDNFITGVDGKAILDQIVFKNVEIPIANEGNKIDVTKVAKRLDVKDDTKVTAITGFSPAGCSADTVGSKVDLYISYPKSKIISYLSACDIKVSSDPLCIVADNAAAVNCTRETANLSVGSCVFECTANLANRKEQIRLGFKDKTGISNTLTEDLLVSDLGRILPTDATPVSIPAPIGAGVREDGHADDGVTVAVLGSVEDTGSRDSGVVYYDPAAGEDDKETTATGQTMGADGGDKISTGAAKVGCALVRQKTAGHPVAVWLIIGAIGFLLIFYCKFASKKAMMALRDGRK